MFEKKHIQQQAALGFPRATAPVRFQRVPLLLCFNVQVMGEGGGRRYNPSTELCFLLVDGECNFLNPTTRASPLLAVGDDRVHPVLDHLRASESQQILSYSVLPAFSCRLGVRKRPGETLSDWTDSFRQIVGDLQKEMTLCPGSWFLGTGRTARHFYTTKCSPPSIEASVGESDNKGILTWRILRTGQSGRTNGIWAGMQL